MAPVTALVTRGTVQHQPWMTVHTPWVAKKGEALGVDSYRSSSGADMHEISIWETDVPNLDSIDGATDKDLLPKVATERGYVTWLKNYK